MDNSKLKTATMFIVAAILVAGTISMTVPASFAQKYYGEKEYKGYDDSYGKDYDKKKTSEVNIQKVKCNNIIVNGIDVPSSSPGGMFDGTADENDGAWAEDGQWVGDGHKGSIGIDKNIVNICINKNNEIVEVAEDGNGGNGEVGCEACWGETLNADQLALVDQFLSQGYTVSLPGNDVEPEVFDRAQLCQAFIDNNVNRGTIESNVQAILIGALGAENIPANAGNEITDCILAAISNEVPTRTITNEDSDDFSSTSQPQNITTQNTEQSNPQLQNTEQSNPQLAAIQKLQQLKTQKLSDMIE